MLHEPKSIGNKREYIIKAIDSTSVSSVGEYVNRFEEAIITECLTLNAAMACAQLELLDKFIKNKRELATSYQKFIFIQNPINPKRITGSTLSFYLREWKRDAFLTYANNNNVMTRPAWTLMHKLPMFKDCLHDGLETSSWIEDRLVRIPRSISV